MTQDKEEMEEMSNKIQACQWVWPYKTKWFKIWRHAVRHKLLSKMRNETIGQSTTTQLPLVSQIMSCVSGLKPAWFSGLSCCTSVSKMCTEHSAQLTRQTFWLVRAGKAHLGFAVLMMAAFHLGELVPGTLTWLNGTLCNRAFVNILGPTCQNYNNE